MNRKWLKAIESKREWLLVFELGDKEKVNLETIYKKSEQESDFEYNYALQESIDTILDMKVNKTILFQHNRDDKNSKALLTRIN